MRTKAIPFNERFKELFWSKVEKTETCWNWKAFKDRQGYGLFCIKSTGTSRAPRVSYQLHHPDENIEGLAICHTCDNPACVNPKHLFKGTWKDNLQDMVKKGRSRKGEKAINAKLTTVDVLRIRANPSISSNVFAKQFGMSRAAIIDARSGKNWKHIT